MSEPSNLPVETQQANQKLIKRLLLACLAMFGFGFALVPLYDVFCEVTGINGRVVNQVDAASLDDKWIDRERLLDLQFLTKSAQGTRVELTSYSRGVQLNPGEIKQVTFSMYNPSAQDVVVQAVPSVAPGQGSLHLQKTECFCFEQQTIKAGELIEFPMIFYVDRDLPEHISLLTLSYTLYQVGQTDSQLKQDQPPVQEELNRVAL